MSISGVSSCPPGQAQAFRSDFQQLRDGFKGIDSALQSGDLDGAKNALDSFTQAMQDLQGRKGDQSQQQSDKSSSINDDIKALSDALNSDDADAAKKAFETLQKDMQSVRQARGHHHHHHRAKPPEDSSIDQTASAGAAGLTNATGTGKTTTGSTGSLDISA
jgi:ribosomal protein S20